MSASKVNDEKYKNDLMKYCTEQIREVDKIFGDKTRTTKRNREERHYWHLLKHRFELDEMIKITLSM